MAVVREFDQAKGTVILKYKGEALTPELNVNDPEQLLEVLSLVIEKAYQKIRDAGVD